MRPCLLAIPLLGAAILSCKLAQPASAPSSRSTARRSLGIWLDHEQYTSAEVEAILTAVRDMGLNTVYPCVWKRGCSLVGSDVMKKATTQSECAFGTRQAGWLNDFLVKAPRYGVEVVPWFEWGFKVPVGSVFHKVAQENDWILKGVPDPKGEVAAQYLDVSKGEVRKILLDMQKEFLEKYKVSAVQWDDHLGVDVGAAPGEARRMEDMTTAFALELGATIKAANARSEIAPNNAWWAKARFASQWRDWKFDRVFVQNFVPANFKADMDKSLKDAFGFGLLVGIGRSGASQESIVRMLNEQAGLVPQDKAITFFHYDAIKPENRRLFTAFFKGGPEALKAEAARSGCPAGSVCKSFSDAERGACRKFSADPAPCSTDRWDAGFYEQISKYLSGIKP